MAYSSQLGGLYFRLYNLKNKNDTVLLRCVEEQKSVFYVSLAVNMCLLFCYFLSDNRRVTILANTLTLSVMADSLMSNIVVWCPRPLASTAAPMEK